MKTGKKIPKIAEKTNSKIKKGEKSGTETEKKHPKIKKRRESELNSSEYQSFRRTVAKKECMAEKELVTVDRREVSPKTSSQETPKTRTVKAARRRQIDPTTCERDYTTAELEFMSALDEYKRQSGRMFPTCSEILEVLKGIGYAKESSEEAEEIVFHQEAVPEISARSHFLSSETERSSHPMAYTPPFE